MRKLLLVITTLLISILLLSCTINKANVKHNSKSYDVIVELNGVDTYGLVNDTDSLLSKDTCVFISDSLKTALDNYKDKEVWFKLIAYYPHFIEYDSKSTNLKEDIIDPEIEFLKNLGVTNISEAKNSSEFYWSGSYYMEATAQMIELMLERKTVQLTLAPPERIKDYNNKISDTLTYYVEKMSDSDSVEIIAVSIYDNYNSYSYKQDIGKNPTYNNSLFVPFSKGVGLNFAETNNLLEQCLLAIMKRNNIIEKRIINKNLPTIGFAEIIYPHTAMIEDIPVGFNAVLTKAEILKLAEDEEIKVIYLAKQNN